jgi:hypothetical protein
MEFVNSRNELFGAIRIPILKGIGRDEIKEFMFAYKAYVRRQDVRRNAGENVETLSVQSLVDLELLETIAIYELEKGGSHELEEGEIEQYLRSCLAPSRTHVPSLRELFANLKFSVLGVDSRKKVVDFFQKVQRIIDENGLEQYDERLITKRIVEIIQPRKLKSLILDDIDFKGKERFQTRTALFKLVMHHANNLSFYGGSSSNASLGLSSSRFEGGSTSKSGIKCFNCKGNHKKKDCKQFGKSEGNQRYNNFFSSNQSAKKIPVREFGARKTGVGEMKFGSSNISSGDDRSKRHGYNLRTNPKKSEKSVSFQKSAIRNSNSANGGKVKKVDHTPITSVPTGCSGMATLEGTFDVPYQLDSGADHSVIYTWMVDILHKRAFIGIKNLESPLLVVLGDGSEKMVTQVAVLAVKLQTEAGAAFLPGVQFRILPGDCEEILIGRSELQKLNVPTLEASLAAVVKEERDQEDGGNQADGDQESQIRVIDWMDQPTKEHETSASEHEEEYPERAVSEAQPEEKKAMLATTMVQTETTATESESGMEAEEAEVAETLTTEATAPAVFKDADAAVAPTATKAKELGRQERVKVIRTMKKVEPQRPKQIVYMDDIAYIEEVPGRRRARRIWEVRPPRRGRARPVPRVRGRGVVRYKQEPRGEGRQRKQERQRSAIREALAACAEKGDWLVTLNLGPAYQHATLEMGIAVERRRQEGGGLQPGRQAHAERAAKQRKKPERCWRCGEIGHLRRACKHDGAAAYEPRRQERNRDDYPSTREEARQLQEAVDERQRKSDEKRRHETGTRPPGTRDDITANPAAERGGGGTADKQRVPICDGCGGRHWLRECTTTSSRMKDRIWALQARCGGINSTSGAEATGGGGVRLRQQKLRRRDICAACFGAHTVGRCPVPGRLHWNAANWPGMGCFGCGGDHPPHDCQWVARAKFDTGWEQVFRRMWCFGCGGQTALRACKNHSTTDKDRIWKETWFQYKYKWSNKKWAGSSALATMGLHRD